MTIFLCVVIFSELSISDWLVKEDNSKTDVGWIYYYINYFLLTFFILEIMLKLFGYAHIFLMELINVFDSVVVIISFVFQVIGTDLKFVGLLRILRLIKVITEMKRVADAKKAKQEAIKKQKKQSSSMASHVERVIDFLERCEQNVDIPKMLVEDIQWAIEVISANQLYTGSLDNINFNTERPEIKAWTELISLKQIPTNYEEMERLKEFEELHKLDNQKKGRKIAKVVAMKQEFNPEETQEVLINKSQVIDSNKNKRGGIGSNTMRKGNPSNSSPLMMLQQSEFDIDIEFLTLADLLEIGIDHLE